MSSGRLLMEKIVFVSREPENHAHLIAMIEAVFPECTVEIIHETDGQMGFSHPSLEKDLVSCAEGVSRRSV